MGLNGAVSRRALVLFLALGVLWGIPYLLIKYALVSFSPVALVVARTTVGGLVLLPWALRQKAFAPLLARWRPMLAYTVVEIAIPWIMLSRAEQRLSSGLTALLIAAVPVVGVILSYPLGRAHRLGPTGAAGLLLGMGGVALLVGGEAFAGTSGEGTALALAEMALVVVGYAAGPAIIDRWLSDVPSSGVIVVSLLGVSVLFGPFAVAQWPAAPEPSAVLAIVLLGLLCTALAFVCFFALVAEVGPVRTTAITYVNPAVAVLAGAVFLREPVTLLTALGFAAIVGGSVLLHRRPAAAVPA